MNTMEEDIFSFGEKEYPFYRKGMSRAEFEKEYAYYCEHFEDLHRGKYKPLWKQKPL